MTTGGGRGVVAALVLAAVAAALAGCTETADETRSVSNHLDRVDGVTHVEVTPASWEHGVALAITYEDADDPAALAALIGDIDDVATAQDFTPYRLTLTPAGGDDRVLIVDDTFSGSAAEPAALRAWFDVGAAMVGSVTYEADPTAELLTIDAGGGIAHDVAEARRIGYGGPATRWTFRDGVTTFVVGGAVSAVDETLLARVQSDVASPGLPATAAGWRLGRYAGHVRLDLDVVVDDVTSPARLTARDHGREVEPLATAALDALRATGLRRFLSLQQAPAETPGDEPSDVFATWTSTQAPARGRDRLGRGWDAWLEHLAASSAAPAGT